MSDTTLAPASPATTALDAVLAEAVPSPLNVHRGLALDLAAALDGRDGWYRLDGATFVAAGARLSPQLCATIIGRPSGWTVVWQHGGQLETAPVELTPTAADAVALVDVSAPAPAAPAAAEPAGPGR